ncbi:MAG: amidohydrolase family protein [Gammaproteobacteria bacterium]|nr:amidohydrolase family protein [Gammaproteobacteria bacterium]
MLDLVIRNGNVVDGTGRPGLISDVGIAAGYIREVGRGLAPGKREIDAAGHLVTPGWVDIHTHYDGQATWDAAMTPSSWHGVTTTVFGNCGVGFAPVRKGSEGYLINLMEGVEDIPETVLAEGLSFDWESFGDYLNVLEQLPRSMDVGAQVPHGALRFYVMGERGAIHSETPSDAEIEQMGTLLEQALHDGALGFTTSRTTKHRAADGRPTPGLSAAEPELAGLARAMKRAGKGVIEVNSDFGAGDFTRMRMAAEIAGRPLSVLLVQVDNAPDLWRETLAGVDQAVADGLEVTAQVGSRAIGVLMTLRGTVHPFATHPLWNEMSTLGDDARIQRLASDAGLRESLLRDRPDDEHGKWMTRAIERTFELGDPVDYEPAPQRSIARLARSLGRDPFDLALELMLRDNGNSILLHPFENYCSGDLSVVEEMLCSANSVCGVADGGAHVGLICDASSPTSLLTLWGRDRTRGRRLPLEFLVHKQTQATARTYGLWDRGVIAPGYRADINIIDFAGLCLEKPYVAYDLPAGGRRILQRAKGYLNTFVAGVEVTADDEDTGARPGGLLRGAQLFGGGTA